MHVDQQTLDTPRIATFPPVLAPFFVIQPLWQITFYLAHRDHSSVLTHEHFYLQTQDSPNIVIVPPFFFFAPLSTLPLEPFCGSSFAWPTAAQNEYRRVHGTTVCQRRPRGPKPRGHNRSPLLGRLDENGGETGQVLWFSLATPSWPSSA